MKKNDIFTFKVNDTEVAAIVMHTFDKRNQWHKITQTDYLCYSQNRIFVGNYYDEEGNFCNKFTIHEIITSFAVIPELDSLLEDYYHQLDMADDYANKTV